ncbi:hypothetical protein V5O48_016050 [Marasmius crinis-equi]|uniref:F-box domain-containing protein n=1 Tax=Marasmius crinis-equi TaxID=585013 RepID=A0ABR3EST0_9AGAR
MAAKPARQLTLPDLSEDLIYMIASPLALTDLKSTRATCRILNDILEASLFRTIVLDADLESFSSLLFGLSEAYGSTKLETTIGRHVRVLLIRSLSPRTPSQAGSVDGSDSEEEEENVDERQCKMIGNAIKALVNLEAVE